MSRRGKFACSHHGATTTNNLTGLMLSRDPAMHMFPNGHFSVWHRRKCSKQRRIWKNHGRSRAQLGQARPTSVNIAPEFGPLPAHYLDDRRLSRRRPEAREGKSHPAEVSHPPPPWHSGHVQSPGGVAGNAATDLGVARASVAHRHHEARRSRTTEPGPSFRPKARIRRVERCRWHRCPLKSELWQAPIPAKCWAAHPS